jgi:hypothetical protein
MKLQEFKIKSEAEDTYHLEHPNGRTFTVEKKGLAPRVHDAIKKMCSGGGVQSFDNGGMPMPKAVPPPDSGVADQAAAQQQAVQDAQMQANMTAALAPPPPPPPLASPVSTPAQTPSVEQVRTEIPPNVPAAPLDPLSQSSMATNTRLDTEMNAVKDLAKSYGQGSADQQRIWADAAKQLAKIETPDQTYARHQAADAQFLQHMVDNKIDPNRYVNNMGTGSKIVAGIALALGGLGAGRGGQNLAYETIHNAINNDIESQKADQSKTMNLWKMNRDQTQDEIQANLQTKNQLLSVAQARAAQAGANIQNAEGRLRIAGLVSSLQQQKDENNRQLGLLRWNQQSNSAPGAAMSVDPTLLIPANAPPELKKAAIGEVGEAQEAAVGQDRALSAFDDLAKENTAIRDLGRGFKASEAAPRFRAAISPLFKSLEGNARQQAIDAFIDHVSPAAFDTDFNGQTAGKRQAVQDFISSKTSAPTFKYLTGMDLGNFASTSQNPVARMSPQLQNMYSIAKAHPNEPAAQAFFKKYNLK